MEKANAGRFVIVEGIDVANDAVVDRLKDNDALKDVTFDVIVHNAGSLGGHGPERTGSACTGPPMEMI